MRSVRFAALALIIGAFLAAGAPLGAPSASAASIYDDAYQTTNTAIVSQPSGVSCTEDLNVTNSWGLVIQNSTRFNGNAWTSLSTAFNSGDWVVTQSNANGAKTVLVYWTEDHTLGLNWHDDYIDLTTSSSFHAAEIGNQYNVGGNCENAELLNYTVYSGAPGGSWVSYPAGGYYNLFAHVTNVNTPVDYEGSPVVTTPAVVAEITPDIAIQSILNWHITAHDLNFNTFDKVPFTCTEDGDNVATDESGLTPVMDIEIYNSTNVLIDSGTISPTVPFEFDVPKLESSNDYTIITKYDCGGTVVFPNSDELLFSVNEFGSELVDVTPCFNPADITEFDINDCLQSFYDILDNLMFNTVKVGGPDVSSLPAGCHTLGTLGDWLNVPASSRTICPQFSETVRNIVTPFITFLLGLIVMRSIVNKSSRSDF